MTYVMDGLKDVDSLTVNLNSVATVGIKDSTIVINGIPYEFIHKMKAENTYRDLQGKLNRY